MVASLSLSPPATAITRHGLPPGKRSPSFGTSAGDDSIFVVPAEGGVPREVVSTGISELLFCGRRLTWSEDSKWIAYSGPGCGHGLKIHLRGLP